MAQLKNFHLTNTQPDFPCIYFIGIGGAGMSALAGLFRALGFCVAGSDMVLKETTTMLENLGVQVFVPQNAKNIKQLKNQINLIVASNGVPQDNPELVASKKFNLPIINYPQALGILTNIFPSIGIAGTHGKSSTTAIVSKIFSLAKPYSKFWALIGALNPEFGNTNFRYTPLTSASKSIILNIFKFLLQKINKKQKLNTLKMHKIFNNPTIRRLKAKLQLPFFVFESDEYKDAFLQHSPVYLIVTNTDFDHADYFKTHKNYLLSFAKAILNTQKAVILNKQSPNYQALVKLINQLITAEPAKQKPEIIDYSPFLQQAQNSPLYLKTQFLIEDTAAALALANKLNIKPETYTKAVANYKGIWRRFQIICKKPYVINDYAHNPKKILYASFALRDFARQHKLTNVIVFWEPHQYHRTYSLQKEFAQALEQILQIPEIKHFYITDIFAARSTKSEMQNFNSKIFVKNTHKYLKNKLSSADLNKLSYANKDIDQIKQDIKAFCTKASNNSTLIPKNTQAILIMSAGKLGEGW